MDGKTTRNLKENVVGVIDEIIIVMTMITATMTQIAMHPTPTLEVTEHEDSAMTCNQI